MISIRKKKLTQWLRFIQAGNHVGLADVTGRVAEAGSAGNPINMYCIHAMPVGANIMMAKITRI